MEDNNLSKKERKRRKREERLLREEQQWQEELRLEREMEERIRDKLDKLGLESSEDFYDALYDDRNTVVKKDIGFETWETAYNHFCGDSGAAPASAYIRKIGEHYIVWINGEMSDGIYMNPMDLDDVIVYDTLEEAKKDFDSIKYGLPTIKNLIESLKEELDDNKIWIDVKHSFYSRFDMDVKYDGNLILEKGGNLTAEKIKNAVEKYKNFKKNISECGANVMSIYKLPREWNDNQRYYAIEFCNDDGFYWTEKIHIPSRLQHKMRYTVDVIRECFCKTEGSLSDYFQKKKEELIAEQAENRKRYQYLETHNMDQLPFDREKAKSLEKYVAKKMGKDPRNYKCDGSLRHTRKWIKKNVNGEEEQIYAECFLMKHGGYCDCEVLMNVFAGDASPWQ